MALTGDEAILSAALLELAEGPMPLSDLVDRLQRRGVMAIFDGLDHDVLMIELDDILLATDQVWTSEDQLVALTASLLEDAVFTHRLSGSELQRGVLDATPDLGAIDFDAFNALGIVTGGTLRCRYASDGESELDEHGSYDLPLGALSTFSLSDLICLRRIGAQVAIEKVTEIGPDEAEEKALRAAFENQYVEGVGVEADQLVMDALCHSPSLFRHPTRPVGELLKAIGLERRGAWFGPSGEDWQPPGVRYLEHEQEIRRESWGFDACCESHFETVRGMWAAYAASGASLEKEECRTVARGLAHGSVAPAFAEYVLKDHDYGHELLVSFALDVASVTGKLAAPAHYLRALEAERDGRASAAEECLRASALADPEYTPALAELAWYEADRGNADRAMSLLRRAGVEDDDPELSYLATRVSRTTVGAGRNDPCPCGSGRKYKACCLNGPTLTIEERAGWLYHKAVTFSLRPQRRDRLADLYETTAYALGSAVSEQLLGVLVDLVVFEVGGLEEFVAERGALLPHDELLLARTWLGTPLILWEIVDRDPGATLTLRDTKTGDQVIMTERSASRSLHQGDYLLARVVMAGTQRQIVGLPLDVSLRQRDSLIELLDSDPDADDIALWLAAAFGPPQMANREGEDTVLCRATLRPDSGAWEQLAASLDQRYGTGDGDEWTETVGIGDEVLVRCFLRRRGDDLVVETNSVERFERILTVLRQEIDVDLDLVDEERLSPRDVLDQTTDFADAPESLATAPELTAEMATVLEDMIRSQEESWLDEQIPALGGLTPRQAADDPTRREDLITLLKEFDRTEDLPPQMMSFEASRLRGALGL